MPEPSARGQALFAGRDVTHAPLQGRDMATIFQPFSLTVRAPGALAIGTTYLDAWYLAASRRALRLTGRHQMNTNSPMEVVDIKRLKAGLSEYVRLGKAGETVLVFERGEIVAELRPARGIGAGTPRRDARRA